MIGKLLRPHGRHWRLSYLCAAAVLSIVGPLMRHPAVAGDYTLIQGEGVPVCEAYRRNLEPRHEARPMACERRYDPSISGFMSPPWKELSLREHFDLYRKAWVYLQEHNTSPQGSKLSDQEIQAASRDLSGTAQAAGVRLFEAQVALTDDDRRYNVLAVREQQCGPHQSADQATTRLFVLNDAGTRIATDVPKIWNSYHNATIELYKQKAYLESYESDDDWGTLLTGSGVLHVRRLTHSGVVSVCAIKWTPASSLERTESK